MKLWRKMGHKVVVKTEDGYTLLSGRQFKYRQQMLSGMKDIGSVLLQSLCEGRAMKTFLWLANLVLGSVNLFVAIATNSVLHFAIAALCLFTVVLLSKENK